MRGILTTTVLVGLTVFAQAARADFHGACSPTGTAGVGLAHDDTHDPGLFAFSGFVNCGGASTLDVVSLRLLREDNVTEVAAAEPDSCGPCDSIRRSSTTPAAPGRYVVSLRFNVRVGSSVFTNRVRSATFDWSGSGQPTRVANPVPPSLQDKCAPPGAAMPDLTADTLPGGARFAGTVTCPNATSILARTSVRRPDGRTVTTPIASCTTDCAAGVIAEGRVGAATAPGDYVVTVEYSVAVAGLTLNGKTTGTWLWLGAGPTVRR